MSLLNIILIVLVVILVFDLYAFLVLWYCFEEKIDEVFQNEKGGVE